MGSSVFDVSVSVHFCFDRINSDNINFSEKILLMIKKTDVKQITNPIVFNKENIQFYVCSKININKKTTSQKVYDEKRLMEKVNSLTNKILKILKKDAIIDIKIKINELN